jgi:hypothetical protein
MKPCYFKPERIAAERNQARKPGASQWKTRTLLLAFSSLPFLPSCATSAATSAAMSEMPSTTADQIEKRCKGEQTPSTPPMVGFSNTAPAQMAYTGGSSGGPSEEWDACVLKGLRAHFNDSDVFDGTRQRIFVAWKGLLDSEDRGPVPTVRPGGFLSPPPGEHYLRLYFSDALAFFSERVVDEKTPAQFRYQALGTLLEAMKGNSYDSIRRGARRRLNDLLEKPLPKNMHERIMAGMAK